VKVKVRVVIVVIIVVVVAQMFGAVIMVVMFDSYRKLQSRGSQKEGRLLADPLANFQNRNRWHGMNGR
jgi:hypothetical protein